MCPSRPSLANDGSCLRHDHRPWQRISWQHYPQQSQSEPCADRAQYTCETAACSVKMFVREFHEIQRQCDRKAGLLQTGTSASLPKKIIRYHLSVCTGIIATGCLPFCCCYLHKLGNVVTIRPPACWKSSRLKNNKSYLKNGANVHTAEE